MNNTAPSDEAAPGPDGTIGIKVGDEQLVLRSAMLGVGPASALRLQSHGAWTLNELNAAVNRTVPGPEEVAGLLFLARRQAGQDHTYDKVAGEVDKVIAAGGTIAVIYSSEQAALLAVEIATAEIVVDFSYNGEDDSPEA